MALGRNAVFVTSGLAVALTAVAVGVAVVAWGIQRGPRPADAPPATGWPAGTSVPAEQPGLVLPDVTGLAGPDAAGPHAGPASGPYVKRLTVLVDKSGAASVAGLDSVRPWRGVDLPKDVSTPISSANWDELVVHLRLTDDKVRMRVRGWETSDLAEFGKKMGEIAGASGGKMLSAVIVAKPDAPFGCVAGATAVFLNLGIDVEFRPPAIVGKVDGDEQAAAGPVKIPPLDPAVRERIRAEAARLTGQDRLSALGVRIRSDSRVPWGVIQAVMMECMKNCVWRISFAGFADGREVVIGQVRSGTAARSAPVIRKRDIFRDAKPVEPDGGDPGPAEPRE